MATFESMQDEIAQSSGFATKDSRKNMKQEDIQVQTELVDLLPAIEEANLISIALDKKVKFAPMAVPAQVRLEIKIYHTTAYFL